VNDDEVFDGCLGGVFRLFDRLFWLAVAVFVIAAAVTAGGGGR